MMRVLEGVCGIWTSCASQIIDEYDKSKLAPCGVCDLRGGPATKRLR